MYGAKKQTTGAFTQDSVKEYGFSFKSIQSESVYVRYIVWMFSVQVVY